MSTYTEAFVAIHCGRCDITFGMPWAFYRERAADKKDWYCPNGHARVFLGKSDKQRIADLEEEVNRQQGMRRIAERDAKDARTTAKRETTRRKNIEKRVTAGVCMKCHRHFTNVERHYESKHGAKG